MTFWEAYDRHYPGVRRFAFSLLRDPAGAEDVVQETFLRLERGLGQLAQPEKVAVWLFRVAHNLCIDALRARRPSLPETAIDAGGPGCAAPSAEGDLSRSEMGDCVRRKLDLLPPGQRAVLLLFDVVGLSHQEIAEVLGMEVGAAKARLHRARASLRGIMEHECTFERDERDVLVCEPAPPRRQE